MLSVSRGIGAALGCGPERFVDSVRRMQTDGRDTAKALSARTEELCALLAEKLVRAAAQNQVQCLRAYLVAFFDSFSNNLFLFSHSAGILFSMYHHQPLVAFREDASLPFLSSLADAIAAAVSEPAPAALPLLYETQTAMRFQTLFIIRTIAQ